MAKKATGKPTATVGNRSGLYDRRERIAHGREIMAIESAKHKALQKKKKAREVGSLIDAGGGRPTSEATYKKYLNDAIQEHADKRKVDFGVADVDYELAVLEKRMVAAECPEGQMEALRSGDLQLSKTLLFELTGTTSDKLAPKIKKLLAEQL